MSAEARPLWEPLPGERPKAFAAFELYRQLGPGRSVEEAWRRYRVGAAAPSSRSRTPSRAMPYFSEWAVKYRWQERARAWDAEQAEIERDQRLDRELQARAQEHEEELRQRQLMREEARAARTTGRRLLLRLLQGVDAGQLEHLKVVDLLPHLQKIASLVEVGQRLERLCAEEPEESRSDTRERQQFLAQLVAVIKEFVPPERWADLQERLDALGEE